MVALPLSTLPAQKTRLSTRNPPSARRAISVSSRSVAGSANVSMGLKYLLVPTMVFAPIVQTVLQRLQDVPDRISVRRPAISPILHPVGVQLHQSFARNA